MQLEAWECLGKAEVTSISMLFECFLTSIDSKAKLIIYILFINSSKKGSSDWNKLQWGGT